jgi:DNA-binding Lrp family transcriptional regulator
MRNERLVKIGVFLDTGNSADSYDSSDYIPGESKGPFQLSTDEIEAVRLLQMDLPAVKRPFAEIINSAAASISEKDLLNHFRSFLERGIIRRYAAVLRHRNAGFSSNSMTAWKPSGDFNIEPFSESRFVSHLYFRSIYPGKWEHPLFAMIHARTDDELNSIINELSQKSGIADYISLVTLREFRKKRVTYFSKTFKEWKRLNYD